MGVGERPWWKGMPAVAFLQGGDRVQATHDSWVNDAAVYLLALPRPARRVNDAALCLLSCPAGPLTPRPYRRTASSADKYLQPGASLSPVQMDLRCLLSEVPHMVMLAAGFRPTVVAGCAEAQRLYSGLEPVSGDSMLLAAAGVEPTLLGEGSRWTCGTPLEADVKVYGMLHLINFTKPKKFCKVGVGGRGSRCGRVCVRVCGRDACMQV